MRILDGQLLYRDFFSFYTPGSFYWNALLLKVFGDSALVPRTVLLLYGGLFSLFTFLLARRLAGRTAAIVATLLLLVSCMPVRFLVIHNWDSTVAALLALYCAVLFLEKPGKWLAAWVGLFTAAAILFNQARGGGLLLGFVLAFLILRFRLGRKELGPAYFVWMAAGLLLPLLVTGAFFALRGALPSMMECMLWPLRHYTAANHLPYGYITLSTRNWNALFTESPPGQRAVYYLIFSVVFVVSALPIFVVLVAAACVLKPRSDLPQRQVCLVVLCGAVVLGSLLSVEATRPDFHHVTFITPLFFFVLPWIYQTWMAPYRTLRKAQPVMLLYVLIGFIAYGMSLMWAAKNCVIPVQTRRGKIRVTEPNETIAFIQANFPPGSQLLVHPYLPLYSFLTRTVTPLRYDYLQPGMHTPQQFQEGAAQLAVLKPAAVLLEPDFGHKIVTAWPRTPLSALQEPISSYIYQNYKVCRILDVSSPSVFAFMVRKDLQCSNWQLTISK